MPHPDSDLLVDAALDAPLPADVTAHLGSCPQCAAEVADFRRTAAAVRAPDEAGLVSPPARVWGAIAAELTAAEPVRPLVTAGPTDRQVLAGPPVRDAQRPRWYRRALVAACAAGIVVGSLTTYAVTRPSPPPATAITSVAELSPLGQSRPVGRAELVATGATRDLHVQTEPLDPKTGYLEVWLINKDLTRMISVGVLRGDATTLPVDPRAIDEGYVIVDISREAFDDKPQHSGQTLARGTLRS